MYLIDYKGDPLDVESLNKADNNDSDSDKGSDVFYAIIYLSNKAFLYRIILFGENYG